MLNLTRHSKFQVPNTLAVIAAILLLVSSFTGMSSNPESDASGLGPASAVRVESADNDSIDKTAEHEHRGLNLEFLLFRRG